MTLAKYEGDYTDRMIRYVGEFPTCAGGPGSDSPEPGLDSIGHFGLIGAFSALFETEVA
jgi:hypothetical protein